MLLLKLCAYILLKFKKYICDFYDSNLFIHKSLAINNSVKMDFKEAFEKFERLREEQNYVMLRNIL